MSWTSPGAFECGANADRGHYTAGPTALEADEQIETNVVALAEAVRMCLAGEVKDAKTVTAVLWWERLTGQSASPYRTMQ